MSWHDVDLEEGVIRIRYQRVGEAPQLSGHGMRLLRHLRLLAGCPGVHTGGVREKPIGDPGALEAIADEVEAGGGPVALVRPGHLPVVLVSAEDWQRLDELESVESTAWWRRDAAGRRDAPGEAPGGGEHERGLDEEEFRRRFAHLFRSTGAA